MLKQIWNIYMENLICNDCNEKMNKGEISYESSPKIVWYGGHEAYKCKICGRVLSALEFNYDE